MMKEEAWKSVIGYEGIYEISSHGNLKSFARLPIVYKKLRINKEYYIVGLWKKQKCKTCKIHRLVAEHFILNPENKPQVNHIDGNKLNNYFENLEWTTAQENMNHAVALQLTAIGIKNGSAKLKEKDILNIKKMYFSGYNSQDELASIFNVSQSIVGKIISGDLWGHIKYDGEISPERTNYELMTNSTRHLRRSDGFWSKLSEEQVLEIKKLHKDGFTYDYIANIYNVTKQTIWGITAGKTWKHIK